MVEQISTSQPVEDPMLGQVDVPWRNCGLWRGVHTGAEEKHEEEGATERNHCVLTDCSCHNPPSHLCCSGDTEELGVKE